MRKFFFLSTHVLIVFISSTLCAQDFSNKGKDFWVGYGYHQVMTTGNQQEMVLYFATDQVTNITITIPALGYVQNITTPPGNNVITSAAIPKTGAQDARLNSEGLSNKGIHIVSDKPMVAYAHIYNSNVSGATILYPTNTLGKEYFSVNYKNWANTANANCWFYVVAVDTGTTTVEITPTGNTIGGWTAGNTYTVNLTQGQIYNVMGQLTGGGPPPAGNPYTGVDLTGSRIRSVNTSGGGCKRIAVFSGSGRISITCNSSSSSSDNYMVQSMPRSAWGKKYLTTPAFGNQAFNIYRVCVSDPATVVRINGFVTGLTLQNNFYYEIPATNQPQLIEADQPIMVAQYFTSQGQCGNGTPGDPEVIYLSSVEQNISTVLWNATPNFAITGHYFNVVIPNTGTALSSFRLDGAPVGGFITHPQDPNYSYLRLNVSPGQHRISSDSGFNAIAYGFGNAESYGYNAGTNIKDLYQQVGVTTEFGIETTPSVCINSPFKFKISLPYCADSIRWDLSNLPGPPPAPPTMIYTSCTPGPGGPDSTTIVNGRTIRWYSLPNLYSFATTGTFPVTITAYNNANPDGCGNAQEIDFDLLVSNPPTPSFTWTPGGCYLEPFQFTETTSQTPKPTYRFWWNFGDPASGAANTSTLRNPTHTFTAPGSYNVRYAAITTPGCLTDTLSNTVIVAPLPSGSITGATTVCINSPQPLITFSGTDGTPGYTFTYTINGGAPQTIQTVGTNTSVTLPVPTNVAGTFRYTLTEIRNTGSTLCFQPQNAFVDVVVVPDATLTLTSAPGTNNQTVCVNTPINSITYAVGGSGTGGTVSGLPSGITGTYSGGVITISGTPTVSGTFNYTVSTTGPCITPSANGTITVTADGTIALTSAPGSDNQTLCINTSLSTITYAIGGSSTGGTVTGLPAGVTGAFAGGILTISGTPAASGTFNYTVNTTGPCVNPSATGTITVLADATLTLTSGPGTNNQTVCVNTPITNITYAVGGSGTGGSVSGLPAGITGVYAGGVITISGTPTITGTFNYTVSTTGPCATPNATGTITVNGDATISLTSAPPTTNQELCVNAAISNITYTVGGTGSGATVSGLPAGVTGTYAGGIFTISGIPTVSGVFNYTVTATGICAPASASGTITVNALPTASFTTSAPTCQSGTITFTDNSLPNSGVITSWSWDFGDGSTSTLQNPTHVYSTAGTYNVLLVVTTNKGCVSTTPAQQVTVYSKPNADFIPPEVCLNDTHAQFLDASTVPAPDIITAWQWNFGDGGTSTLQNPTHTYLATGPYTVQLIVTTNRGCRDTIVQNIFVNGSFPVANFTLLNPTTLCANDSVSIVEASTVFPGTITKVEIYWDHVGAPGVFVTDENPFTGKVYKHLYPNFQTPLTRTFTIRYRAYSGGVCVNEIFRNITVNAAPRVQFTPIPDICPDAPPYQITQASEIGGVPGTGVFSGPGVSPTGLFNPAVAGPGTHTIKYVYTSSAAGCRDSLTQTIKVFAPATANFSVSAPACERQPVTFTDNSTSTEGTITQWRWNFGDGTPVVIRNNGNPVLHTYNGYGTYTVRLNVVTSNGCVSPERVTTVEIKPLPRPNFTFPPISCLPNANVTFTNTSTIPDGTQSQFTYLWNFGDPGSGPVNISTAMNPSHTYVSAGPFNVNLQVTSGAGCVRDTTIVLNTIRRQPIGSFSTNKIDVCIGESITFTSTSNPVEGTTTQWFWDLENGTIRTTPSFTYTYPTTGTYNVRHYIYNSFNCKSSEAILTVSVNPYPVVNAGPDKLMLEGGQVQLTPTVSSSQPVSYLWSPAAYVDNPTILMPMAKPPDDMNFTLLVTTNKGCSASDVVFVKVLKKPDIPNIFSPNGDGIHDRWEIKYLDTYPGCTVDVVNRYGQLVFRSIGYATPWDGKVNGKDVPVGTYYYVIDPKNGRKPITGYVDIIR